MSHSGAAHRSGDEVSGGSSHLHVAQAVEGVGGHLVNVSTHTSNGGRCHGKAFQGVVRRKKQGAGLERDWFSLGLLYFGFWGELFHSIDHGLLATIVGIVRLNSRLDRDSRAFVDPLGGS